jgi:acetyl esterase/lipase
MSFAKFMFVAIDKLYDKDQNEQKSLSFSDKKFEIENDVVYDGKCPDACRLDTCYVKKESGRYPVFFYIHGGGFVAGDKHHRRGLMKWAAAQGFFVVNVNYGLSPDFSFPDPVRHLVSALEWVGGNSEKYNLDLQNMMVSGDSAGGYYSALLASVCTDKRLQERLGVSTDLRFRGAMIDCGIYDVGEALGRHMPLNLTDKILFDFAGIHIKDFDNYEWKDICAPIDFVSKDFPVTFITYAEQDIFCKGQGNKLFDKLKSLGVHVEEDHSVKFGDNHCYPLSWKTKAAAKNVKLSEDFMRRFIAKEI